MSRQSVYSAVLATLCTLTLASFGVARAQAGAPRQSRTVAQEVLLVEKAWGQAILGNDPEAIARYMANDWIMVDAEGHLMDKTSFLAIVKSGDLTHDAMTLQEPRVRVYGSTVIVTGRATSKGKYRNVAFATNEISTDVFVKQNARWQCVLTQLSPRALESDRRTPGP